MVQGVGRSGFPIVIVDRCRNGQRSVCVNDASIVVKTIVDVIDGVGRTAFGRHEGEAFIVQRCERVYAVNVRNIGEGGSIILDDTLVRISIDDVCVSFVISIGTNVQIIVVFIEMKFLDGSGDNVAPWRSPRSTQCVGENS